MYMLRSLGTLVAMLLSYIAWYIVDGNTAGVIVFFFIFCHGFVWLMIKHPSMLIVSQIGQTTMVRICAVLTKTRRSILIATLAGRYRWL